LVRLVFEGSLSRQFGKSVEIEGNSIHVVFKKLNEIGIVDDKGRIKPGYIVLVNDKDIRVVGSSELSRDDVVKVIPINHGG